MTTTTAPPGGHSVPLGLMSCVRESSPQDLMPHADLDLDRNETSKKRRFHPFRGLRKIFRRGGGKVRNAGSEETVPAAEGNVAGSDDNSSSAKDSSHRSRSTSELLAGDEPTRRKSNSNVGMYPGGGSLSVSHDSVFTAEQHSTRGDSTSSDLDTAQSSSSLSIQQLMSQTGVRAELLDAVRRRGRGRGDTSEDDEDLGLPRSPCNSPTTTDKALKEHPTKSHSTCSDGSLLSMGSSEMDEDSFGQHSRHSSKLSLHDRRPSQTADSELELGTTSISAPLSHSAARHKMAVRPKRTHGAPRRRRVQQLTTGPALPTTPEVNEEISTRSLTPEGSSNRETIAELYSSSISSTSMNKVWNMHTSSSIVTTQLKSASLPPGLALPSGSNKLSRSRSNAGSRKEAFTEEDEQDFKEEKKKEESFFGRFLARRSGKKKKKSEETSETITSSNSVQTFNKIEKLDISSYTSSSRMEEKRTFSMDSGISKLPRSGPAARQRVLPIDIPASPDTFRRQNLDLDLPSVFTSDPVIIESSPPKKKPTLIKPKISPASSNSPEKSSPPIPTPRTFLPHSPPKPVEVLPRTILPLSLSPPKVTWPEKTERTTKFEEECKTKVKITGLSSYQQRFMSYNDEFDGVRSIEDIIEDTTSKITKSQSFKTKSNSMNTQDHCSLPFISSSYENSLDTEYTDSLMSTLPEKQDLDTKININIDQTVPEPFDSIEILHDEKLESLDSSNIILEDKIENKDGITISCVNSQMQASVNTKSSNQVIVSISNPTAELVDETKETTTRESSSSTQQVSITKVQLKREPEPPVPEFLKIQLNRVDKPNNIVLTKSNSFNNQTELVDETTPPKIKVESPPLSAPQIEVETDKDSGEIITEIKRKFSADDVEVIEKTEVKPKPTLIISNTNVRKSSLVSVSPTAIKPYLKKKSSSLELTESIKILEDKTKATSTDQLQSKTEVKDKTADENQEVILRKKSQVTRDNSDEPELMKVFARRSLKLKDSDIDSLTQQVLVLVEDSTTDNSADHKRDSDKENESESPVEERKKSITTKLKEPLHESTKFVETVDVTLRKPVATITNNNKFGKFPPRTVSAPVVTNDINDDLEKRRNKSFIETKIEKKPILPNYRSHIMNIRDKDSIDIKKSTEITKITKTDEFTTLKNDFENEDFVPMFKRIQQRKEEWEQRAQQNMKK